MENFPVLDLLEDSVISPVPNSFSSKSFLSRLMSPLSYLPRYSDALVLQCPWEKLGIAQFIFLSKFRQFIYL